MSDVDDSYRMVIDEGSLDLRSLPATKLCEALETFADLLEPLADGRQVAIMDLAYEVECWDSVTLTELRYAPNDTVPRDTRVRLALLLDKCRTIAPEETDFPQQVHVNGTQRETSWGMSRALAHGDTGRMTSCLVLQTSPWPTGWVSIEREGSQTELHILADVSEIPEFWRGVITREAVPEQEFFALATPAFPGLLFVESLNFHHFRGAYSEILPWAVRLLSALSDNFAAIISRHNGDYSRVIGEFRARDLDISPESSQTKKNKKAWGQRNIMYDGKEYRCDWHGKRLWDRDRIHFSLPIPERGGKILVGVFDGHLDT